MYAGNSIYTKKDTLIEGHCCIKDTFRFPNLHVYTRSGNVFLPLKESIMDKMIRPNVSHCVRYFNVTHCNGLALCGRLVRLVCSNSVWHSGVDAGVIRSTSRFDSHQGNVFLSFSKLFLSSLIIQEVYI